MRWPILLALAILAAGCVQPARPGVTPTPALPATAPPFAGVVAMVDPAGGSGEPSLGVAPDGTLYTNRAGEVLQSKDDGRAWKSLGDPTRPSPNADADLVVDRDGTIWDDTLSVACSTTASSRDQGATWTVSYLGCVPAGGDRQYLVATHGGTAYIYSHHAPTFYQTIAKTTDYGATWTPAGVAEGPGGAAQGESGWGGGGFWNAAKDSVFLTYSWFDKASDQQAGVNTAAFHPAASVSRDQGKTWAMAWAPTAGGTSVGLSLVVGAADLAGNAYLAWAEAKGQDMAVYLSASVDDGLTWSKPMLVDGDAGSKVFPAIAALDPGHVAVAYYHADRPGYPSAVPADTHWNVTVAWTADALAALPSFEHANLSTHTLRAGPICPDGTLCGAINCPSGMAPCASNRALLDYFALKALPDGRVASVWASTDDVPGKVVNVYGSTHATLLAESPPDLRATRDALPEARLAGLAVERPFASVGSDGPSGTS